MHAWRQLAFHTDPVIFYTARVTRSYRERAEELKALITTNEQELFTELARLLEAKAPDEAKSAAGVVRVRPRERTKQV